MMRQLAKIGFTQGYTYFTWKNTGYELMEYIDELAHGPEREYFRPELLHQHAGHPERVPRPRRAGGVLHALRARRDAEPHLRHLLGLRALRERARAPGSEEYLDSEKFEAKQRSARRPDAAVHPADEPDPPREPGAAVPVERRLARHVQRADPRLRQAARRQHLDLRRQPRPPPPPGGLRRRARRTSGCRRTSRSATCSRARPSAGTRAELRAPGPVDAPGTRAPGGAR